MSIKRWSTYRRPLAARGAHTQPGAAPRSLGAAAIRSAWLVAGAIFALALTIYMLTAAGKGRPGIPDDAYFNLLADSLLRGRLYLADPPVNHDLTLYNDRFYVPFPPLVALLLMPFVAVLGVANVNTVLFGAAMGAANAALAFLLLDALAARRWTRLSTADNLWLTVLFALGSVHWYIASMGTVWFLAQICTATFMLAALWLAVAARAHALVGAALAAAMLSRPHVALLLPLLLAIEVQHRGGLRAYMPRLRHPGSEEWFSQGGLALPGPPRAAASGWMRAWAGWAAGIIGPMALAAAALMAYNAARFGSPLDFGYAGQNVADELAADLRTYGQFNMHYLPRNLWAMLLAPPAWDAGAGMILPRAEGMSLLLTTPALALMAAARRPRALAIGAWAAVGLILIPLLTYYNTGWWQFGYRFSLDFMPPALVLLALAAGRRVGWPTRALIIAGVLVNAWGAWWFLNPQFL